MRSAQRTAGVAESLPKPEHAYQRSASSAAFSADNFEEACLPSENCFQYILPLLWHLLFTRMQLSGVPGDSPPTLHGACGSPARAAASLAGPAAALLLLCLR